MCIAIQKDAGKILSEETLKRCWDRNPDGAGFVFAEGGKLHIHKGYMRFENFWQAWQPHQSKKAVLHFRIKTHGKVDVNNTHPFQVGDGLAFVHNGIISNVDTSTDKDMSDTHHFNSSILRKLYRADKNFLKRDHLMELIIGYIGSSKLVFLDSMGQSTIVNARMGQQEDGVWYSNTSYKPPVQVSQPVHRPYLLQNKQPVGLTTGSRVSVEGHPTVRGVGYIAYFGHGAMVGVTFDGTTKTQQIHASFVLAEKAKQIKLETGDYVFRVGSDDFGTIVKLDGSKAVVEFERDRGQFYNLACEVSKLRSWEEYSPLGY